MGNLEEAFVNIGLNPDSFLARKENPDYVPNKENTIEIESIAPPECYFKQHHYSFKK